MDQEDSVVMENHLGQTIENADYAASLDEGVERVQL